MEMLEIPMSAWLGFLVILLLFNAFRGIFAAAMGVSIDHSTKWLSFVIGWALLLHDFAIYVLIKLSHWRLLDVAGVHNDREMAGLVRTITERRIPSSESHM
jgi:hypothetical protein